MSLDVDKGQQPPITSIDDLIQYFARAEKPRERWRVGMEHEKLGFLEGTTQPVPFAGPRGIEAVLERFERFGFEAYREEDGSRIAGVKPNATLSLEPGGQLELSGEAFPCAHACKEELLHHVAQARAIGAELGIRWLGIGYRPFGTIPEMPWMPKVRYGVMRAYLPSRGKHALDMMLMTATVQASYDWSSEEDMARKMRAAMSVSPLVSAIYANSFLVNGRDSGWTSFRYEVWNHVDPDRCGLLSFVFDEDFGYRRWVEYALDVPMFFVRREGRYIPAHHLTFRQFMKEGLEGYYAHLGDFEDHLTTLFPEIRAKGLIEVRGADACTPAMNAALPALWKGILYDDEALRAADELLSGMRFEARLELQTEVARKGLAAGCERGAVLDLARELFRIASEGLRRQACPHGDSPDERVVLEPIEEVLEEGRSPAEKWRERWHGDLGRDPLAYLDAVATSECA